MKRQARSCRYAALKILGAWNFKQLSDGIYVSLMETAFPITPSQGASTTVQLSNGAGAFTNDENLSFASDTLTVDKGLKILEGADHPTAPAAGTGVLWVKNGAPNTLVFTDDAGTDTTLGSGGGGGSGTVTSVATTAPITGGTITGSGTIGISAATTSAAGSMSSTDKTKLDGIEANADVTDSANVTAAGALMDSEVANLADVKAFDPADYATAAQGSTADSAIQSVLPVTLDTSNNRVGINETSPDHILHAKDSGTMDFPFRLQCNGGNLRLNKFGHLQIQNENTHSDADSFDSPFWQFGQRDGGQLDLAFGTPGGSNAFVGTTRSFVTFKSASNSATGAKEIGFYGTSTTAQQTAPAAPPTGPAANADLNAIAIGEIITVLQNLGLIS